MFERFTEGARRAVVHAQEEAGRLRHDYVGTEHLLLGILRGPSREDAGPEEHVAVAALGGLGITLAEAREQVEGYVAYGEDFEDRPVSFTPRAKRVLEHALREALELGHGRIGPAHMLLGLTDEPDGIAARVLADMGADPATVRREVFRGLDVPPTPPT